MININDINNVIDKIDYVDESGHNNFHQNKNEMVMVINELQDRKFNNFLELGVAGGGSMLIYSSFLCSNGCNIYGIDVKGNKFLHNSTRAMRDLKRNFNILIYRDNTRTIYQQFADKSIDLLHIDADHDETVFTDWRLYYPKVKGGGVILLHDTCLHDCCKELAFRLEKQGFNIKTFKDENNAYGISIVYL